MGRGEHKNCISQLYFSVVFLNCISQLYFSICISDKLIKMSKGGAGGAAANCLLLKKNEDK